MMHNAIGAVYWDASAILSALMQDAYSDQAHEWAKRSGIHLISTLAFSEVHAVFARIRRERLMADIVLDAAREAIELGPWRRLNVSPRWEDIEQLSDKWRLRGADLWHLAVAKTLQREIPELCILTFDERLRIAASGEGFIR